MIKNEQLIFDLKEWATGGGDATDSRTYYLLELAADAIDDLSYQNQQLKKLIINTEENEWNGTWKIEDHKWGPKLVKYFEGGYATVESALEGWLEEND